MPVKQTLVDPEDLRHVGVRPLQEERQRYVEGHCIALTCKNKLKRSRVLNRCLQMFCEGRFTSFCADETAAKRVVTGLHVGSAMLAAHPSCRSSQTIPVHYSYLQLNVSTKVVTLSLPIVPAGWGVARLLQDGVACATLLFERNQRGDRCYVRRS